MMNAAQILLSEQGQKITLRLDDLLLHKLQENMTPLSLNELQAEISPTRPITAIIVAASLARLHKKGQVVRELVGEGRAHYVYSAKFTEQTDLSKRGDL